ncbi:glycosyltransferase family 2 protein [Vogesella indigofera]|uniref:Glycosyltransferase n=1 Tax=Vogesella indigofera TaxID=45465 RepID=A0ABT5I0F5_VOGIN|nr:glycosyltransferase [Vogesella indigofera]MDC7689657.1 glycosyltransferase [Vogesella indigofera]
MENKISVVIPCYNSCSTITRALDSILSQTHPVFEIICIDDRSTDHTINVIEDYKHEHPEAKITILKNENNIGPSASRNKGIVYSRGDFIAFLDSDDFWFPEKTRIQLKFISENKLDGIGSSFLIDTKKKANIAFSCKTLTLTRLLFSNPLPTPSVLIRRDASPLFNVKMQFSEDYDLWLRLVSSGLKFGYIAEPLIGLGKPSYGHSGLSANLAKMQIGELTAIQNNIGRLNIKSVFFQTISILKFIKRVAVVSFRKIKK